MCLDSDNGGCSHSHMSPMLQMYHASMARLHPNMYQSTLSFWPHAVGHVTSPLPLVNPTLGCVATSPATPQIKKLPASYAPAPASPTRNEDSGCGSSGCASNSSDTNGSDTNSGDEVDVEVIDTEEPILKPCSLPASSLSFSISNLLGGNSKNSPKNSCGSPSGTSSASETDSAPTINSAHQPAHFHHFAQHFAQGHTAALPFRPFKTETQSMTNIHSSGPANEYKCDLCGKCFKHVRMLNRHRRNHSPYKKYKCTYCSKGFNDSFDLKRHVRTHTGVKPYKCDYCEKSFTQRCSLESHQDKIHGIKCTMPYKKRREKIYVCEDCGHSTGDVREHYKHAREAHANTLVKQEA